VGKVLLERLLRAADRGVRVRLLLDDLGTMPSDEVLLAIDSHPNIEVRMFNPASLRSLRLLGILADIGRLNGWSHSAYRRMVAGTPRRDAEEQTVNGCYDVEKWRPFALNVFQR
jgi:hypothetical protein